MYEVVCECGHAQIVSATKAGAKVDCPCGRAVAVPKLSDLRRSAPVVGRRPSSLRKKPPISRTQWLAISALIGGGQLLAFFGPAVVAVSVGRAEGIASITFLDYLGNAVTFCGVIVALLLYRVTRSSVAPR